MLVHWQILCMMNMVFNITVPLSLSPPSLSQRTKATIKIFSEPMPNSNERSIQLMGTVDQIMECVHRFLDDISKVRLCLGGD